MKKGKILLLLMIPATILLLMAASVSNGTDVWIGEATTTEEKLAKEACECMYSTLKDKGYDADLMLGKSIEEIKADKALSDQLKEIETLDYFSIPCFQTFMKNKMREVALMRFDQEKSKEAYKKCRLPIYR